MNISEKYIEGNTESNISKQELSKHSCINFLFLSENDIRLIHDIHNILVSHKTNSSVRSFFEKIILDEEKLISFCERFNYDIDEFKNLIQDSLEYPAPKVSQARQNVKLVAEKVLQQREIDKIIEIGFSYKAIKAIQFFFKGISISKILEIIQQESKEEIAHANSTLGLRELSKDRIMIVRNQLYNQNYSFYTNIFKHSNEGKEYQKLFEEERSK